MRQARPANCSRLLTPIAKSWPSEWCLEANSLAIQVHGGYGYTRDFPVEQYWRDNRLNMIHEGTHGIQALDLLGRKVVQDGGRGLALLRRRIEGTIGAAEAGPWADEAAALRVALQSLLQATHGAWSTDEPEQALANATPYLQGFGQVVLAWIWLDVALAVQPHADRDPADAVAQGQLSAARYFFRYELPKVPAWFGVVERRDSTCRSMRPEQF